MKAISARYLNHSSDYVFFEAKMEDASKKLIKLTIRKMEIEQAFSLDNGRYTEIELEDWMKQFVHVSLSNKVQNGTYRFHYNDDVNCEFIQSHYECTYDGYQSFFWSLLPLPGTPIDQGLHWIEDNIPSGFTRSAAKLTFIIASAVIAFSLATLALVTAPFALGIAFLLDEFLDLITPEPAPVSYGLN